jgi:hypothetical protein
MSKGNRVFTAEFRVQVARRILDGENRIWLRCFVFVLGNSASPFKFHTDRNCPCSHEFKPTVCKMLDVA